MSPTLTLDEKSPTNCEEQAFRTAFDGIADRVDDRPRIISQKFVEWVAENYYIDGLPFSFGGYEPLEEIYRDESREIVVMKSAQCGASEWLIAYSFYFPLFYGENVFYGMPAKDQIKDFVQGRVDPRVDDSSRLQDLIVATDNIDLKQVGVNFIYYRGSQNRRQIATVDAGLLILDEHDLMVQAHVPVMEKRLGDSAHKIKRKVSVPSTPEFGIHREYLATDMREYHLRCSGCYKWVAPTWDKNISPAPTRDRSARTPEKVELVCHHCGGKLDRKGGKWIATNESDRRGYHISKLIMPRTDLRELWIEYRDTINLQDFHNSNLGLPYIAEGGKLEDRALNACRRSEAEEKKIEEVVAKLKEDGGCTMGIDVGARLNVRISKRIDGKKHALLIETLRDFEELDKLMEKFDVWRAVVDGLPETREAFKFAERHPGRVYLAYYSLQDPHKTIEWDFKSRPMKVLINRTRAMDETAQRFLERQTRIPQDAHLVPDYYDQMRAPQRVKVVGKDGNEKYSYLEGGRPDHYYHAEVYDDVADSDRGGSVDFI